MIYCPNPNCNDRENTNKLMSCQTCETTLVIKGRYQLLEPLRKISLSGCAEVFTVQDLCSTTKVMKIMRVGDPKLLELFDREAQVLKKLDHYGIPKREADGYFSFQTSAELELKCLVMEKIAGVNLEKWLQKNKYCPPDLALQWLKQLVNILEYLHQEDLFHRDIKPANIILRPDGQIALVDFGAVRQITNTIWGEQDLTLVHTPAYAPHEQLDGQAVPQSDFYALGRTFVHLLTSQSPLNFPVDHGCLQWRDPNLCHFPKLVADLVDQLMTTRVEERPQSADLIRQKIEHIELEYSKSGLRRLVLMVLMVIPLLMLRGSNFRPVSPFITYGEKTLLPDQVYVVRKQGWALWQERIFPWTIEQTKFSEAARRKKAGMNAFADENYQQAIMDFNAVKNLKGSDPETQIFLHNAKILLKSTKIASKPSYTIAINISTVENIGKLHQLQDIAKSLPSAENMTDANMKVALVQENDHDKANSNNNQAEQAAQDLAKQPDIVGVIGPTFRQAVLNVDDVYCKYKVVNIALVSRAVNSKQATNCKYMFHLVPNEQDEMKSLAHHISHKMHYKKVAIFFSGSPYSLSAKTEFKNAFTKKSGHEVTEFDSRQDNFKKIIRKALKNEVEAIVIFPFFRNDLNKRQDQKNLNNLLELLKLSQDYHLPVIGGTAAFNQEFLEIIKNSGKHSEKVIIQAPCCSDSSNGHWKNTLAHDALQIFMTAWKQNPTKSGIYKEISDPEFKAQGKSGQITFSRYRDRHITNPEFVQVSPNPHPDKGYSFVPLH